MVFPWQKIMQSEQNPYCDKNRGSLIVGTINNPIYSILLGMRGESGLNTELEKTLLIT